MFKEFKEFAVKGNAIDLAVGVIIGAAFGQIVNSFVNDLIMPVLSLFTGKVNFNSLSINLFGASILRYGSFLNVVINFLLVALVVFLMVKQINRFRKQPDPQADTKQCPYCLNVISLKATRCPHCTSELVNSHRL